MNISKWVFSLGVEIMQQFHAVCGPIYPHQGLLGYPLLGLHSLGAELVTHTGWPPTIPPLQLFDTRFTCCHHPSPLFKSKRTFKIHLSNMLNPFVSIIRFVFHVVENPFHANKVSHISNNKCHVQLAIT